MKSVYEHIDSILSDIGLPFYHGMPEFDEANPEPEKYLVYDEYETPVYLGDGIYPRKRYFFTVNIFTPAIDENLFKDLESRFMRAGFVYTGGGKVGEEKTFPYKKQYYKEFQILWEV